MLSFDERKNIQNILRECVENLACMEDMMFIDKKDFLSDKDTRVWLRGSFSFIKTMCERLLCEKL